MTAQDVYNQAVKPMPAAERLRLAAMILNDIAPQSVADFSEQWSDEDLQEFTRSGWRRAEGRGEGNG